MVLIYIDNIYSGIGRDSFILASAGYRVHMFEKNIVLHSLLEDGMIKQLVIFFYYRIRILAFMHFNVNN